MAGKAKSKAVAAKSEKPSGMKQPAQGTSKMAGGKAGKGGGGGRKSASC